MLGVPVEQAHLQPHQEDRSPSNVVGGGDDIAPAEPLGEGVDKNPEKNTDNRAALTSEGEIGAALMLRQLNLNMAEPGKLKNILNQSLLNPHLSGEEEP